MAQIRFEISLLLIPSAQKQLQSPTVLPLLRFVAAAAIAKRKSGPLSETAAWRFLRVLAEIASVIFWRMAQLEKLSLMLAAAS
mmetsp:Transcript_2199/g.2309  ORF Transcript_2199/g.2309 Transcript_2199/m.2309 type:complete len:83 (-) Transcript_2199:462-710(-)